MSCKSLKYRIRIDGHAQRRVASAAMSAAILSQLLFSTSAFAQVIPGPADAGRIEVPMFEPRAEEAPAGVDVPQQTLDFAAPEGAAGIAFELKGVRIEGVTAFSENELADIYAPYVGRKITLDMVWAFAGQITERYRAKRFFLSRAFVPAQEIEDGTIVIRVVEGHVGRVEWQGGVKESRIIRQLTEELLQNRPLSTNVLESYLLRVNDLPGHSYRAVVQPSKAGAEEAAVTLAMVPQEKQGQGLVSFDNYGSRFLGPLQASLYYNDSFIPMQQTYLSLSASTPADELKYGAVLHQIPVLPRVNLELNGSYVVAEPGYSLEINEIESKSAEVGVGITYQPIRQWLENMTIGVKLTGKDTDTDILGTPLIRDRVRVLRTSFAYDRADILSGYSYWNASFSRGLEIFGSSSEGEADLSRLEAAPDFMKVDFSYTRQQPISNDWLVLARVAGQWADSPLYSSEEFGFGGQGFGRAYDPSEITGDHGIAASAELRYNSAPAIGQLQFVPFAFYDVGKVWNIDAGLDGSASSAGLGVAITLPSGISATLTAAQPLTRDIDNPINGGGEKAPRLSFGLSYKF